MLQFFFIVTFYIAAVVVRFLTGRYLSEYASSEEVTYERNVLVDEKQVSIKITDVAGKVGLFVMFTYKIVYLWSNRPMLF